MLERGDVTSGELVECYLARIEALNPKLNSYITVAADHARAAAEGCRRPARRRRRALTLPRGPDLDQGPRRHRRHREHPRHRGMARSGARTRRRSDRKDPRRGLRVPRQDGGAGVRPAQHQRAARLPARTQPVEPRPQLWRLLRRRGRGARVGYVPDLARLRRRRLDPQPVVVVRRVRLEAAARSHLARAEPAEHVLARRPDHAHGRRRGRAARRDGRATSTGDGWWAPPPARPFLDEVGVDPGKLRVAFHPHPGVPRDECAPANRKAAEDAAQLLADLGHEVEEARAIGIRRRGRDECRRRSSPPNTPRTRSSSRTHRSTRSTRG